MSDSARALPFGRAEGDSHDDSMVERGLAVVNHRSRQCAYRAEMGRERAITCAAYGRFAPHIEQEGSHLAVVLGERLIARCREGLERAPETVCPSRHAAGIPAPLPGTLPAGG